MALTEQEEFELLSLEREKAMGMEQSQQTEIQPKQNIIQQLLQATQNTIGGIAGGIIQPPTKIIGRAGQTIESMVSGQPPQEYSIPLPWYLGGNIDISPAQNVEQAFAPLIQTTAMTLTGNPTLAGSLYGLGSGVEEQDNIAGVAGKTLLGGLLGKGTSVLMGKTQLPKNMAKYDNALKQAEKAKMGLDTLRTKLGQAKEIALQEVRDIPAELDWSGNVSQKVVNAIKDPIYKVEFTEQGGVVNTIGNLDKIKTALQDVVTKKDFIEAGNMEKRQILQFAGRVRDTMLKAAKNAGKPELANALKDYHQFMDNYNLINDKLVDKYGNAMANKLKSTFKWDSEPAIKEAWKEVGKASPEIKSVMNSMNRRELMKNLLKTTGYTVGLGLAGKGAISLLENR